MSKTQLPPNPYELSAEQKRFDRRKRIWRWARTLVLCLLFYLLSTGPVCRAVDAGLVSDRVLKVYAPLVWVTQQSWGFWLDTALQFYICTIWHASPLQ